MPIGDLVYYAGILGLVIYGCFMVIRQAGRTGKLADTIRQYDERIARLQQRRTELRAARDEKSPGVEDLLQQVIDLRGRRDRLQIAYEEMETKARDRDIPIKMSTRGS